MIGQTNYCHRCEKKIPWRAKCQMCQRGLCWTCKCTCPLSQPGAVPLRPSTRKPHDADGDIAAALKKAHGR